MKINLKEKYNTLKMKKAMNSRATNSYKLMQLTDFRGSGISGGGGHSRTSKPKEYKPPEVHENYFVVTQNKTPIISTKDNHPIIANGSDGQKIIDNWLDKDESYFWWSNQKVYNIAASNLAAKEKAEASFAKGSNTLSNFLFHAIKQANVSMKVTKSENEPIIR